MASWPVAATNMKPSVTVMYFRVICMLRYATIDPIYFVLFHLRGGSSLQSFTPLLSPLVIEIIFYSLMSFRLMLYLQEKLLYW